MSSAVLLLPPLVGQRSRARKLVDQLPWPYTDVVIDCRDLIAATRSFVDELISLTVCGELVPVQFVNVSDVEVAGWITEQAAVHRVSDQVSIHIKEAL